MFRYFFERYFFNIPLSFLGCGDSKASQCIELGTPLIPCLQAAISLLTHVIL